MMMPMAFYPGAIQDPSSSSQQQQQFPPMFYGWPPQPQQQLHIQQQPLPDPPQQENDYAEISELRQQQPDLLNEHQSTMRPPDVVVQTNGEDQQPTYVNSGEGNKEAVYINNSLSQLGEDEELAR